MTSLPDERPLGASRPWAWTFALVALGAASLLTFVLVTNQVWEDFLITFRHSKNLVEGNGLVFNPGRRVQGFTSAINTMLPAFFYWITGKNGYAASLNLYRVVCGGMYLLGGVTILRPLLRDRGADRWSPLVFVLLFATDAKTVAFTMNGQEVAFMVGFLALGFVAAYKGIGRHWKLAAVSWAGLLYTRPDVPVHIAALVIAGLIFSGEPIRESARGIAKAAGCAAVAFLPWFVFVWIYYGQPIPHTVIAKSGIHATQLLTDPFGTLKLVLSHYPLVSGLVFEPIYASARGWPDGLLDAYSFLCAAVCTCYWIIPTRDRLGRAASLAFTLITLYLSLVDLGSIASPWYLPSATLFGLIVLSRAPIEVFRRLPFLDAEPLIYGRSVQTVIVACSTLLLAGTIVQVRIQQREIEDNIRRPIGRFLHDAMRPGEIAYMEPLGYIGYFSDQLIYDWPGLVTPEVAALHHEKGLTQIGVIEALMPDWLVLRTIEMKDAGAVEAIKNGYEIVRAYDASVTLDRYDYIPGRNYLNSDARFFVLRKRKLK